MTVFFTSILIFFFPPEKAYYGLLLTFLGNVTGYTCSAGGLELSVYTPLEHMVEMSHEV